jgi:hypothetical protein
MGKKNIIRVINEEISSFDYLNIDELENSDNRGAILNSKDFQTKLVYDIINQNKATIIDWEEQHSQIDPIDDDGFGEDTIKYLYKYYDFKYHYNEHIFNLNLEIIGEDLPVTTTGTHVPATQLLPPEHPEAESVDYRDIQITFADEDERDEINTEWLDKDHNLRIKIATTLLGSLPE